MAKKEKSIEIDFNYEVPYKYVERFDKVHEVVSEIRRHNAEVIKSWDKTTLEEKKKSFRQWKEGLSYDSETFSLAMEWLNVVGTRFIVSTKNKRRFVDITEAMNQKVYGEEEPSPELLLTSFYVEKLEQQCFMDYILAIEGKNEGRYKDYIEAVKKMNDFVGTEGATFYEDMWNFRNAVNSVIEHRRNCLPVCCFTENILENDEVKALLKKEELSYQDAFDLAEEVIAGIGKMQMDCFDTLRDEIADMKELGTPTRTAVIDIAERNMEESEFFEKFLGMKVSKSGVIWNERNNTALWLSERYITNYLEKAGIGRKTYDKYFKNVEYASPQKKLAWGLALYLEPVINGVKGKLENVYQQNVERFMHQNSVGILSEFATVSATDFLKDSDVLCLLEDGATADMMAFFLKHYAKTENPVKKKEE